MTPNEYQVAVMRTANTDFDLPMTKVITALGLNGEAGELGDIVKKEVGHGHGIEPLTVLDEAGDVLWYLARLITLYGWTLEEVMEHNVAKLLARYPEGFDPQRSQNR